MPFNSPSVSIQALKQYVQAAQELGVDTAQQFRAKNLDVELLQDNEQRIDLALFEQLLLGLITASEHPFFGLYASNFITPSTYASLGLISMTASTLRDSIELVPTYEPLVGDMGTTELREHNGCAFQLWHCQLQNSLVRRHVVEAVLSSWFLYGRKMLGLEGELLAVRFEHGAPAEGIEAYQAVFSCQPEFGAEHTALVFPTEALDAPLPQANSELQQSLIQHANQLLQQLQPGFLKEVRQAIELLLAQGQADKGRLAGLFGISERTLQRRLQEENSSYQQQLAQVRYQLAQTLLQKNTSMDSISQQLGFAETRSFFRRFKQWSGETAGQYRRRYR